MSLIGIVILASFSIADLVRTRVRVHRDEELKFGNQAQIKAQSHMHDTRQPISDFEFDQPISTAHSVEADLAGASVIALEYPVLRAQSAPCNVAAWRQLDTTPHIEMSPGDMAEQASNDRYHTEMFRQRRSRDPASVFSKVLAYITNSSDHSQEAILRAACGSFAFSCEEIIQLADNTLVYYTGFLEDQDQEIFAYQWKNAVSLFAEGRDKKGCISDVANVETILDAYSGIWPGTASTIDYNAMLISQWWRSLQKVLIDNDNLKPAKNVEQPPMRLQTGFRTDADIGQLLEEMRELQLIKAYASRGEAAWYVPGGLREKEFEKWLKQIRAEGEQFSGSQLVSLVRAVPAISPRIRRHYGDQFGPFRVLLQDLEQHVTGVTCEEVKEIILWMQGRFAHSHYNTGFWPQDVEPLASVIVDGQNKVDLVAFVDLVKKDLEDESYIVTSEMEEMLRGVGGGLPLKNNPVFGVVKGNPVILVVDESTSMDTNFALGNDAVTRRKFCEIQLEAFLKGLPKGTYFNVIQYSSSAVKIFAKPVLASKSNIRVAIQAMGRRWTSTYKPEEEPLLMLRNIQVFALRLKHQLNRSSKRNASEALEMAYSAARAPSQQADGQEIYFSLPQIYFLISGDPDGEVSQVLATMNQPDKGRAIPINSIAFITPADLTAKQFAKRVARKTGGFFRSIEQESVHKKKRKREPNDG